MEGHHKNTCPLGGGGSEINILKANGGVKEKRVGLKEQQIYQSNYLEFTWDFMLNKYQCKVSRSHCLELEMTELNFPLLF